MSQYIECEAREVFVDYLPIQSRRKAVKAYRVRKARRTWQRMFKGFGDVLGVLLMAAGFFGLFALNEQSGGLWLLMIGLGVLTMMGMRE